MAPINLIVYAPTTEKGKEALARRVSDLHAEIVTKRIRELNCPTQQKLALFGAVIKTTKSKTREQT